MIVQQTIVALDITFHATNSDFQVFSGLLMMLRRVEAP